jgi:hypothetical protein
MMADLDSHPIMVVVGEVGEVVVEETSLVDSSFWAFLVF